MNVHIHVHECTVHTECISQWLLVLHVHVQCNCTVHYKHCTCAGLGAGFDAVLPLKGRESSASSDSPNKEFELGLADDFVYKINTSNTK